jgi:hypothetical protein
MQFLDHPKLLLIVAILSFPVYVTLAKIFWGEKFESLGETLKYLAWPDIYSAFKGKYWEDWDATMKFYFYIGLCFSWPAAITELLVRYVLPGT